MKFTLLFVSGVILPMVMLNMGGLLPVQDARTVVTGSVSEANTQHLLSASSTQVQANPYVVRTPTALPTTAFSALNNFVATLKNGVAGKVVGVYVSGVLALPVTQQPINHAAYVNTDAGSATQFGLATQYGSTGLLAHNYLAGALFFNMLVGQEVDVIYGDGLIRRYKISIIRHLQALNPTSPASNFVDMDDPSSPQISNADLFFQTYGQAGRVVFQTCINAQGNPSWGRLFVIAIPIS